MNFNIDCLVTQGSKNMGVGKCNIDFGNVRGLLLVPKNKVYKVSEFDTLIATFRNEMKANAYANRSFIVKDIMGAESANVDPTEESYGYGTVVQTIDAKVGRIYTFRGNCQYKALGGFDKMYSAFDYFPIFDGNMIAGTPTTDPVTLVAGVKGFAMERFDVGLYNETIQALPFYTLTITQANANEWRNLVAIKAKDGDFLTDLNSLVDIGLINVTPSGATAGVFTIDAQGCSDDGFIETYGEDLVASAWNVTNADTGAEITLTSVAVSPTNKFVFTLDTLDADYIAATRIKIAAKDISTIEALGVVGYEIGYAIVKK